MSEEAKLIRRFTKATCKDWFVADEVIECIQELEYEMYLKEYVQEYIDQDE